MENEAGFNVSFNSGLDFESLLVAALLRFDLDFLDFIVLSIALNVTNA